MVREAPLRTSGQRARRCQGAGPALISGKSIPGQGNSVCKGSEAGTSLACLRNSGQSIVVGAERGQPARETGREGRGQITIGPAAKRKS